jgi:hypothetical protein
MEARCLSIAPARSQSSPASNSGALIEAPAAPTPVPIRMLRTGYIPQKSYHFSAMTDPLAQLLHCVMETVACPMDPCADADSRFDAGGAPVTWAQAARESSAADLTRRDHVQRFSVQRFRPVL